MAQGEYAQGRGWRPILAREAGRRGRHETSGHRLLVEGIDFSVQQVSCPHSVELCLPSYCCPLCGRKVLSLTT